MVTLSRKQEDPLVRIVTLTVRAVSFAAVSKRIKFSFVSALRVPVAVGPIWIATALQVEAPTQELGAALNAVTPVGNAVICPTSMLASTTLCADDFDADMKFTAKAANTEITQAAAIRRVLDMVFVPSLLSVRIVRNRAGGELPATATFPRSPCNRGRFRTPQCPYARRVPRAAVRVRVTWKRIFLAFRPPASAYTLRLA